MDREEHAMRVAAWAWAGETLGIELTPERLSGLVETSDDIRVDLLQPALKIAIRSNETTFLPPIAAVKRASNRLAGELRDRLLAAQRNSRRPLLREGMASKEEIEEIRQRIADRARGARG